MKSSTKTINKSILICGCGRSGTSIMGRLIASHKNVEYCFDPPLIHKLIYFTRKLNCEDWRELFETYLYTDIFIGGIAGRNLNFNRHDLSYIFHHKTKEEIESRLDRLVRRSELFEEAKKHTLCVKATDALLQIEYIKTLYPGMRFIVMCRNANDTISSVVKQRWFSDESISNITADNTLPMRIYNGFNIPLWVDNKDIDFWVTANEIERAAMYYIKLNSILLKNIHLAIIVHYDAFSKYPHDIYERLRNVLKIEVGEKTYHIIKNISCHSKQIHNELMNLSGPLRGRAESISSQLNNFMEFAFIDSDPFS